MKKKINILLLTVLSLFSFQCIAASVSEAVTASKENNTTEAIKLWASLASSGTAIAQYNIANHYRTGDGVEKNTKTASKWLKNSARSGFVEAYLNLNKNAISPAKGKTLHFEVGPQAWLKKQAPNSYTIQLASSRNENSIKNKYEQNNIEGKGAYYHYVRDGVDRYGLVYGSYKTVAAANIAMAKLPEKLRKKSPWVRSIKSILK